RRPRGAAAAEHDERALPRRRRARRLQVGAHGTDGTDGTDGTHKTDGSERSCETGSRRANRKQLGSPLLVRYHIQTGPVPSNKPRTGTRRTSMPITVNCTCGKQYPVKEEFAGQRVKCPDCGQVLTIPGIQGAPANGASDDDITAEPAVAALDDLPEADDGDMPIVQPVKKKGGRGLLYAFLGCGCVTVLLGGGVLAAVLVVVWVGGVGGLTLWSLGDDDATTSVTDKDKDKSRPADDKPKDDKPKDDKPKDDKAKDDKPKDKDKPKPPEEKGPWKGHLAAINAVSFAANGKYGFSVA